jgi:predicted GNAT family N-acyltransferase
MEGAAKLGVITLRRSERSKQIDEVLERGAEIRREVF